MVREKSTIVGLESVLKMEMALANREERMCDSKRLKSQGWKNVREGYLGGS